MADVGSAIVDRLELHADFWEAVGGRVDWGTSPPGTPAPRCVLTIVTAERPDHYDGEDVRFSRLQLDIYSEVSSAEANRIAEESVPALRPEAEVGGVRFNRAVEVDGPTDSGEQTDTVYLYRSRVDYGFLHANEEG